jgi:hypothetical protein
MVAGSEAATALKDIIDCGPPDWFRINKDSVKIKKQCVEACLSTLIKISSAHSTCANQ